MNCCCSDEGCQCLKIRNDHVREAPPHVKFKTIAVAGRQVVFLCLRTAPTGQNGSLVYLEKNPPCLRQPAAEELKNWLATKTQMSRMAAESVQRTRGETAGVFDIRALMFLMSDMLQWHRNVPSRPVKMPHVQARHISSVRKYASSLPTPHKAQRLNSRGRSLHVLPK